VKTKSPQFCKDSGWKPLLCITGGVEGEAKTPSVSGIPPSHLSPAPQARATRLSGNANKTEMPLNVYDALYL